MWLLETPKLQLHCTTLSFRSIEQEEEYKSYFYKSKANISTIEQSLIIFLVIFIRKIYKLKIQLAFLSFFFSVPFFCCSFRFWYSLFVFFSFHSFPSLFLSLLFFPSYSLFVLLTSSYYTFTFQVAFVSYTIIEITLDGKRFVYPTDEKVQLRDINQYWGLRAAYTTIWFVCWILFHYSASPEVQLLIEARWMTFFLNVLFITATGCFLISPAWAYK